METTTEKKLNHLTTYSLEDDKIRVYFENRISKDDWQLFKDQGFSWTMKQESDLVAYWTPARQDFALNYCNQTIDDLQEEQSTLLERSCDRAERFSIYREKRLNDSIKHLDNSENVIGMQSAEKAEKIASRIEKQREKANSQFSKCSYWHSRIDSVIAHAIFKESPGLRQRRVRTLTSDKAKHQKDILHFENQLNKYQNMSDLEFSEIKFRDGAKPSKDEIILKIENLLRNGHAARWLEHLNFRIDFENRVLESQGIKKLDENFQKFGIVNGKYEIIRVNKSKGVVNSLTVKNPKFSASERFSTPEAIVLIENVISYEAPDSTIKRDKKAVVSTLNLSKEKIVEIFGFENVVIEEMTSEQYKNRDFAIYDVLDGKIISRYESKRNKIVGDFKIRANMHWSKKNVFVILTDKKCDDLKAPVYAK